MLLVCAMILAAACGSAGSGTTGGSGASTGNGQAGGGGEETGPTGEPFKVGVLLPYSGVYAALGESMTNAMELYFESIGWQAGGRPIELIKEDTEANPEVGLRRVRKLVEQDEVDILTGVVSSGVLMSIRDYVDEAGVFLISSNAGAVPIATDRKSPYIWLVSYTNAQPPSALGAWWYENVAQEVFLTAPDYQAGYDSTGAFRETFEAAGGRVVGELFPPLGTTDYAPYLTQIREANPASIYAFFAGSDARNFILAYEQYGLKGQIPLAAAGFMFDETTLAAVGEAAVGHYHSMHWAYTLDNPVNRQFVPAYEERFGVKPDLYAVQAYDAAQLIAHILNELDGDISDDEAVRQVILNAQLDSPRGKLRFDPERHAVRQTFYILRVEKVGDDVTNVVVDSVEDWMWPPTE